MMEETMKSKNRLTLGAAKSWRYFDRFPYIVWWIRWKRFELLTRIRTSGGVESVECSVDGLRRQYHDGFLYTLSNNYVRVHREDLHLCDPRPSVLSTDWLVSLSSSSTRLTPINLSRNFIPLNFLVDRQDRNSNTKVRGSDCKSNSTFNFNKWILECTHTLKLQKYYNRIWLKRKSY